MDVNRKAAFQLPGKVKSEVKFIITIISNIVSELQDVPGNLDDTVDEDIFCEDVENEVIAKGLIHGTLLYNYYIDLIIILIFVQGTTSPFEVKPSYRFWSPWIGHKVRGSSIVYNSESRILLYLLRLQGISVIEVVVRLIFSC